MNKLYEILAFKYDQVTQIIDCRVLLNRDHPVFEGHFPGNPVLPGICTVQIAREIIEKSVDRKLMLARSANIKYLGFVSPLSTPEINYKISITGSGNTGYSGNITVIAGSNTVCTFKGEYIIL